MSFVDQYLPAKVPGMPCLSAPRFKTSIQVTAGGRERRNQEWVHPLFLYTLPEAIARKWDVIQSLGKHWLSMRGPLHSFPWRDPLDFASCDLDRPNQLPSVSMNDQEIGTGDGFTDTFQLVKAYAYGAETYDRPIHLPRLESVVVAVNGALAARSSYSVTRPGGVVQFFVPPANGHTITAGFLFDVEVRYESDDAYEGILRSTRQAGSADLTLIEVRPC